MPKFDSPLGNKKFSGQSMREFEVPDESGNDYPNDNQDEMSPIMRHRGPSLHGSQPPVDISAAMAFQQRMQEPSLKDDSEIERQIREAREAKRTGKERLNDGAKRRIEMLVGMTRSTREVDLDGNVFVFQTIPSKEMREAWMAIAEFDGSVQSPFEMRRQLLARSLIQIAGVDATQFVGSSALEAKLQLIDSLDESILDRLYKEYLIMVKDAKDKFAVKDAEDAKEVIEDLKK